VSDKVKLQHHPIPSPIVKKGSLMNTKNLLDQLLRSGSELLQGKSSGQSSGYHSPSGQAPSNQNSGNLSDTLSSLLSGKGGAALAGGALGLLLGSKSGRKMGGTVLTYGGLAALGALAFKAYQNYQQQTPGQSQPANPVQSFEQLPAPEAEMHCTVILIALIAAAKADGHIDDRERQLIDGEVIKLTSDPSLQQWVDRELKKPLDKAGASVTSRVSAASQTSDRGDSLVLRSRLLGQAKKAVFRHDLPKPPPVLNQPGLNQPYLINPDVINPPSGTCGTFNRRHARVHVPAKLLAPENFFAA
jgi:uncharacterized membrane protein YebE (DUF533 family)